MSLLDEIRNQSSEPTDRKIGMNDILLKNLEKAEDFTKNSQEVSNSRAEEQLRAELDSYPAISSKKVGVRLEEDILQSIEKFCKSKQITVETWLEAAYLQSSDDPKYMDQLVTEAKIRLKRRKRAGTIRSILTKTQNLIQ